MTETGSASTQYSDQRPRTPSRPTHVDVNIGDVHLRMITDRGVFSHGRLDPGTKLLLREAPPVDVGQQSVLDLGCGWGPIACVTARRHPHAHVTAVDVNERALSLTSRNASAAEATNMTVAHPCEVDTRLRFHRILSNPPVRIGKSNLHELLAVWLDRLTPDGKAHLVVHRHLGSDSLGRWLEGRGHRVERLLSRSGYRLLEVAATGSTHTGSTHFPG